jgi:hypothetical protein
MSDREVVGLTGGDAPDGNTTLYSKSKFKKNERFVTF